MISLPVRRVLIMCALFMLGFSAAYTANAQPTAQEMGAFEAADCVVEIPAGFTADCGTLTVPAARDADGEALPDAGVMRLPVVIFRSQSADPQPDPVIYLEGGPGGQALDTIPLAFEGRFAPFLADRDFIMFDQRGTGFAEPALGCPNFTEWSLEVLDETVPLAALRDDSQAELVECAENLAAQGVDFSNFNSRESAQDLDDLRQALGYESWNLYGISYGTRLALTAMRDTPEGIRSVILDAPYPLQIDLYAEVEAGAQGAFNALFAACAADAGCAAAYPDLDQTFYALLESLNAEPVLETVTNPLTGERYELAYTGDAVVAMINSALYITELFPLLPQTISNMRDGDFTLANAIYGLVLASLDAVDFGAYIAVQCHEEVATRQDNAPLNQAAVNPLLQAYFDAIPNNGDGLTNVLCPAYSAGAAAAIENQAVVSDIPTLVMAGALDPITPPAFGRATAETLSNSTFIEFPFTGHGASVSGECPRSIALAFLNDPQNTPDTSCVDAIIPTFQLPATGALNLAAVENDTFGIAAVIPEGWQELGPGVYAESAQANSALIIQAAPGTGMSDILALLESQFGSEIGDSTGTYQGGAFTFDLYELSLEGLAVSLGLAEADGTTYIVLVQSLESDAAVLRDALFVPVMDSLRAL
ncbi:MAG: alpha/beta fold hydrolase [bacterium]|nr:alpha/beta fold hydrolase [bacterium]